MQVNFSDESDVMVIKLLKSLLLPWNTRPRDFEWWGYYTVFRKKRDFIEVRLTVRSLSNSSWLIFVISVCETRADWSLHIWDKVAISWNKLLGIVDVVECNKNLRVGNKILCEINMCRGSPPEQAQTWAFSWQYRVQTYCICKDEESFYSITEIGKIIF